MTPQVLMIASTAVDWPSFLASAEQILKRKITVEQDKRKQFYESPLGFIRTVGELVTPGRNINEALCDSALQRHATYSFLVVMDKDALFEFVSKSTAGISVDHTSTDDPSILLSVITGNMQGWVNTILACCTGRESHGVRYFCDYMVLSFEKMGYGPLFHQYRKVALPDKTFRMLPKPIDD